MTAFKVLDATTSAGAAAARSTRNATSISTSAWKSSPRPGEEVPPRDLLKTPAEIEGIKRSAEVNVGVLDYVAERITPGITTEQIDQWVARLHRGARRHSRAARL